MTTTEVVIAVVRAIPMRPGWARDKRCRLLADWYADEQGEPVYVPEQIGAIVGWNFYPWEGQEPVTIRMSVRVQVARETWPG
jgi:hypothetical protein